jgi:hypothetical protein
MQHLTEKQLADCRGRHLSAAELLQIDDHLSRCAECRDRVVAEGDLRAALQTALPPEHVSYEQLEAYLDGKASAAQTEAVRVHAAACRICSDELRDLESFKKELEDEPLENRERKRRWMPRFLAPRLGRSEPSPAHQGVRQVAPSRTTWMLAAAAAVALVVLLAVFERRFASSPVGHSPPIAGNTSALSQSIEMLPKEDRGAVLEAISNQRVGEPDAIAELQGRKETLLGQSLSAQRFEVVAPVGEVVMDPRPVFRWQALAGAIEYFVAVFDADLNPVQSSPPLGATQWKAAQPLKRGQIYLWQVTAHLRDGKSVSSPIPPSPEAKFQVLDQKKADELAGFQKAHPESHLAIGILCAQAGLLEQGEHELASVLESDPDYKLAQNLLNSIQKIRNPRR